MTSDAARLLREAQALSERDRAELAANLLDSLDRGFDEDAEAAWDAEIARRVADLDTGRVQTMPWPEARKVILERGAPR